MDEEFLWRIKNEDEMMVFLKPHQDAINDILGGNLNTAASAS